MFQVGFLRCHAHDDRDAPINAGDRALHKLLHLGDVLAGAWSLRSTPLGPDLRPSKTKPTPTGGFCFCAGARFVELAQSPSEAKSRMVGTI